MKRLTVAALSVTLLAACTSCVHGRPIGLASSKILSTTGYEVSIPDGWKRRSNVPGLSPNDTTYEEITFAYPPTSAMLVIASIEQITDIKAMVEAGRITFGKIPGAKVTDIEMYAGLEGALEVSINLGAIFNRTIVVNNQKYTLVIQVFTDGSDEQMKAAEKLLGTLKLQ